MTDVYVKNKREHCPQKVFGLSFYRLNRRSTMHVINIISAKTRN